MIYGPVTASLDLEDEVFLRGSADYFGGLLDAGDDADGDGFPDMLFSAYYSESKAYLVLGGGY